MKECSLEECLSYLIDNLNDIACSNNLQNNIPEFARWNTPSDLASDWENCNYFVDRLFSAGRITQSVKEKIVEIDRLLEEASPGGVLFKEEIWTNDALINHDFWSQLREKAKSALNELDLYKR